ncbi:MAG: preprotein translocase subunit SecG [Myxococcota bacterium]
MTVLLTVIHILVCFLLVIIVLLQAGKGADIGAAFGAGASQTMFGSRGATTVLQKATAGIAITFMLTSLGLAYYSRQDRGSSVLQQGAPSAPEPGAGAGAAPEGLPAAPAAPGAPAGKAALPGSPLPDSAPAEAPSPGAP